MMPKDRSAVVKRDCNRALNNREKRCFAGFSARWLDGLTNEQHSGGLPMAGRLGFPACDFCPIRSIYMFR
jgi:hypothetical protein